jgi:hypothetical protein
MADSFLAFALHVQMRHDFRKARLKISFTPSGLLSDDFVTGTYLKRSDFVCYSMSLPRNENMLTRNIGAF